jgi:type VII secretion integral membrane protein EccD
MTAPGGLSLARLTVATPQRRLDIALPEQVRVGELLPYLLRHAGEGSADAGEQHGGWALRRATGTVLDSSRPLAAQGVRDGELLHLVPRRTDWPELAYDDVVEVIASGSRRAGRSWGKVATRRFAVGASAAVLSFGLVEVLRSGPPWVAPGGIALGFAAVALLTGILMARAGSDASAGTAIGMVGTAYAAVGGLLVAAPPGVPLHRLGAPQVLLGSAALFVAAIVGYVGVAALTRVFVAGMAVGLLGMVAAVLCLLSMSPTGAAAAALTLAVGLLPGYPLMAVWLGRLPVPALPERPEEMLAARPVPARSDVFAAVTRSHELLTGLLLGAAIVSTAGIVVLTANRSATGLALAVVGGIALLLRARLFATAWQRIPLVVSGMVGLALLAAVAVAPVPASARPVVLLAVIGVAAALVLAAGLAYSTRAPSPYLRRLADIIDVLSIMALVPLAAAVVGLYRALQGLFASVS